ncbi:transposable element Tcb1 transposase [Trichonephila clavipes]|nr:transposable element Tcb1 transposase [Trichonephila clavipes]
MTQRKQEGAFFVVKLSAAWIIAYSDGSIRGELGITHSAISRLWKRFQDGGNVSRLYNTDRPRVATLNKDRCLAVTPKRSRRSRTFDQSRQLSTAAGTTVSKQTMYRRLGHIRPYARQLLRCVPLTATRCLQWSVWSRKHAMCVCVLHTS